MDTLSSADAAEYAGWFRALGDGTRVQILSFIARADAPLTVGEIVGAVGKSQSTVSRHLQVLADECFVHCRPDGIRTLVTANESCMTELPRAAAEIMGVNK
ncbi:MAG: ArsR/SmtB family transcription factor [Acidimicrobiales bacterium]